MNDLFMNGHASSIMGPLPYPVDLCVKRATLRLHIAISCHVQGREIGILPRHAQRGRPGERNE